MSSYTVRTAGEASAYSIGGGVVMASSFNATTTYCHCWARPGNP
jgi:hypothetical protein